MEVFKRNIVNVFGKRGEKWLLELPSTLVVLREYWRLEQVTYVNDLTYNFVAKAFRDGVPVVIKIGCDGKLLNNEADILRLYKGDGAVRLMDHERSMTALLLQRATPGFTLKSVYSKDKEQAMDTYIVVIRKLHRYSFSEHDEFDHISEMLQSIGINKSGKIASKLLQKATELKIKLLNSMKTPTLLHGDLHLGNILQHEGYWLAIDPKGVIAEPEFEFAAFDFIEKGEVDTVSLEVFLNRIAALSKKANLSFQRVKEWTFLRLILSTLWSIEDNEDPKISLKLAGCLMNSF